MKNTDKVLLAIDRECSKQKNLAEISCFDDIAIKAKLSADNLNQCLDELQRRGYIRYSVEDQFIYLTKEGKKYIS